VSLESDFSAVLLTQCPRVTPGDSDLNAARPFVTWDHIGGDPMRYMDNTAADKVLALLQVNSYAETRAAVLTLANQIEAALCSATSINSRPLGRPFCGVHRDVEPALHYAQQEFEVLGDR
jgi:hypothetical protein